MILRFGKRYKVTYKTSYGKEWIIGKYIAATWNDIYGIHLKYGYTYSNNAHISFADIVNIKSINDFELI